jgi:hypothetical protein
VYEKLNKSQNPFYLNTKKILDEQCPISAHITFKSIQISKDKSLRDCYITDYAISQRFM